MDSCLILYVQIYYIPFSRFTIVTISLLLSCLRYLFSSLSPCVFLWNLCAICGITCLFGIILARVFYYYSLVSCDYVHLP